MIKNRQETIAYIIKEARGVLDELLKHGYKVVSVDRMADIIDRIEADWKREREAGAEAAQICGEIGEMIGREAACKQSVTNCNRLGNVAKIRAALMEDRRFVSVSASRTDRDLLVMADEKRISDAVVQSLRDKKLEMAGEIAAKEAEVAALRALVKEMADVLNETKNYTCFGCTIRDCPGEHECRYTKKYCLLIAKAREAIGGTE